METGYRVKDSNMNELEVYKCRLAVTARRLVAPASEVQAMYMDSDAEPLDMDPIAAYFSFLGMLGGDAIRDCVFPECDDLEEEVYYYPDGPRGASSDVKDYESPVKLERLIDVAREVGYLGVSEDEEFSPDVPDAGERMLEMDARKIEEASRILCVPPSELVVLLDGCEESEIVDVSKEIQRFDRQLIGEEDVGYCLYSPGVATTSVDESRAECLDIINLSHHLGFAYVKIPPYLRDYESQLESSGLTVTLLDQYEEREPDVLYWHGRSRGHKEPSDACYVEYDDIEDDKYYYPSLLYGRGFVIHCASITSDYVRGKKGTVIRANVRDNLRIMRKSRYRGCVFYQDLYREFFKKPLQLNHYPFVKCRDKRRKCIHFPTRRQLKMELSSLFMNAGAHFLDPYRNLIDVGRTPSGHLPWVMLLGFETYSRIFFTVYELRQVKEPFQDEPMKRTC